MSKADRLLIITTVLISIMLSPAMAGELAPLGPVVSPPDNPTTPEKVALGKVLFFDRRLSGDGTMSCANCHDPEMGFSDGLDVSQNYPTTRNWRNSPTLINIAFARSLFHDGRALSLESQALFPMMSAFEMNQNLDYLEEELRSVPEYVEAFRNVFGGEINRKRIGQALAAFERTLISRSAPLDRYLTGDKSALSDKAIEGMELFTGKAGCSRCHFGGVLTDDAFHANGVPDNPKLTNDPRVAVTLRFVAKVSGFDDYLSLTADPGRYLVTRRIEDWQAFRTPTLREVSITAPYMHNGVFGSLEEVVDFYNQGGGNGNREFKPLGLAPEEKAALVAFLREALTGEPVAVRPPAIP